MLDSALLQHEPSVPQQLVVAQELNEKATIAAAPIRIIVFLIRVIMMQILDRFSGLCNQNCTLKSCHYLWLLEVLAEVINYCSILGATHALSTHGLGAMDEHHPKSIVPGPPPWLQHQILPESSREPP